MRLALSVLAAVAATASLATPLTAGKKPADVTWGKPGVSFAQYRQDTLECANRTYGLDVSMKPRTVEALMALNGNSLAAFVEGESFFFSRDGVDYHNGQQGYLAAVEQVAPNRTLFRNTTYTSTFHEAAREDVIDQLQAVLDYCLQSRGYERFKLSAAQREQLQHYRYGTEARARFLHSLSSDPQVLAAANKS